MTLISGPSRQWTAFGVAALVAVLALMWSIGSAEASNVELADAPVPSAVSLDPGTFAHPGLEPGQPAPARLWQGAWLGWGLEAPQPRIMGFITGGAICWVGISGPTIEDASRQYLMCWIAFVHISGG